MLPGYPARIVIPIPYPSLGGNPRGEPDRFFITTNFRQLTPTGRTIDMSRSRTLSLLIALGLLTLVPTTGFALNPLPTCSISYNSKTGWTFTVDPLDAQSFQLDVQFDPSRAQFAGIDYLTSFHETTAPDLSQLNSGLILDIAGATSTPVAGDVNIFDVRFTDLDPSLPVSLAQFTLFADSNSFITAVDPSTGQTVTYTGSQIPSMTQSVPEPSSLVMLVVGALTTSFGYFWHRRKRTAA